MSTPSPLVPQGSLQDQQSRGKSNVRIAVFSIIAVHAVVFAGLLMQGCNRGAKTPEIAAATNDLMSAENEIGRLDPGLAPMYQDTTISSNAAGAPMTGAGMAPATNTGFTAADPGMQSFQQNTFQTAPPPMTGFESAAPLGEAREYAIAKGDTLGKIAKLNGVTLSALMKANPGVDSRRLKEGQKIQIPAPAPAAMGAPAGGSAATGAGIVEPDAARPAASGSAFVHVVVAGDNLTKIAKMHRTTIKAIKAANNLKTDRVNVGQKLKIPAPSASAGNGASGTRRG